MKYIILLFASFFWISCSSGNPALKTAQLQSELSYTQAKNSKIKPAQIEPAKAYLDSSKQTEKIKDTDLALIFAELSNLKYRVIFAELEKEQAKKNAEMSRILLNQEKEKLELYKKELAKEEALQ